MISALCREIAQRATYLKTDRLTSVYLGGGTPSLLTAAELEAIFTAIYQQFSLEKDAEVTIEANPDDLDLHKLRSLYQSPINRLSIGIQSFLMPICK